MKVYTIGFTQKHARDFYESLKKENVNVLVDVRLNNTSQLASFSKYPDIEYFLEEICEIKYIHDKYLAPTDSLLKRYKNKEVSWDEYETVFANTMSSRNIGEYIKEKYGKYLDSNICLLCSEPTADKCHRRLVAAYFNKIFGAEIIHI